MGRDGDGEQRYQSCDSIADPTFRRVLQDDWLRHKLADWVTRLEEEAAAWATPPVLAAHSLACSLVARIGRRVRVSAPPARCWSRRPNVDSPAHTADEVRNSSPV